MKDIVGPYGGDLGITRNATARSKLSARILTYFLKYRAESATVDWRRTGYGMRELYKTLWNTCQKPPYKGRVRVSMREDQLILIRM